MSKGLAKQMYAAEERRAFMKLGVTLDTKVMIALRELHKATGEAALNDISFSTARQLSFIITEYRMMYLEAYTKRKTDE